MGNIYCLGNICQESHHGYQHFKFHHRRRRRRRLYRVPP